MIWKHGWGRVAHHPPAIGNCEGERIQFSQSFNQHRLETTDKPPHRVCMGFFLIAPIYFANAQMAGYFPKGGADIGAEDVSLIQLIANPQVYDRKRVRITGFLHLEFEGNAIYLHNEDFRYALTMNAPWINIPKDMTQGQITMVNDQHVICTGRFVSSMHGHMGMNNGEITDITRLQVWSPHQRPTRL